MAKYWSRDNQVIRPPIARMKFRHLAVMWYTPAMAFLVLFYLKG